MLLPDVNVLIYAHFEDIVAEQAEYARWLTRLATGSEPFALSVLVLSGFVRIATNPRIFDPPSPLENCFRLRLVPSRTANGPARRSWSRPPGYFRAAVS